MSFEYSAMADLSLDLLTEFGQTVTRRAYTAGTYDTTTATVTNTTADTSRIGALFDFGSGKTHINGTLIVNGDKHLLLDAEGSASMTDRYIVGSVQYTVVGLKELNPAGTVCLYELHLRLS